MTSFFVDTRVGQTVDHLIDTTPAGCRDEGASFSGGLTAEESDTPLRNLDESETGGRVGPNGQS